MSGNVVEKTHCTSPTCESSDGFVIYEEEGKYTGYCWVCKHYDANPYGDAQPSTNLRHKTNTMTAQVDRTSEVHAYKDADLSDRGILPSMATYYGIKADPGNTRHYYPYFSGSMFKGYKERIKLSKEFYSVGDTKKVDLFGQAQAHSAGSHRLIITEGELDAVAAFQMLWVHQQGTQYADRVPSVVSLPHGSSGAVTDLSDVMEFIDRYKEVVLCFDGDKAGEEAVREAMKILPIEKVKVAKFTEKDANDMLLKGKEKEFVQEVLWNAKPWKPLSIVHVDDIYESAIAMPVQGLSWPWSTMTNATYGMNRGMLYGIGAGVGVGKSAVLHKIISHLIEDHQQVPGLLMFEEPTGKTLKNLATHMYGKKFVRPDGSFSQEDLTLAIDRLRGKVVLCEHKHMVLGVKESWAEVKQVMRHMVLVEGCKQLIVDPITALTSGMTSSEANEFLNMMMAELAGMAEILDCSILYTSHLNPPRHGTSHEEGGRVQEAQFTGSRACIKWSHYIFGLERNKQADTEEERNTTMVRLLKDREFGNHALFPIYYNSETGSLTEIEQKEHDYSKISSPNLQIPGA